jgi:hypothetical protein
VTSDLDDYVGRVRGVLISVADRFTPRQCGEVEHLIEHGEPAEGMRTLAWIIVEEGRRVPRATVVALRELTAGLIPDDDMPSTLEDFVEV